MGRHPSYRHSQRFARSGFTLVELLVVIGIIVVLVGILIPVVSRVRMSGYAANTQQEISVIENAIARYYDDFHAYPGPFTNDQIMNGQAIVKDQNDNQWPLTMSENCFLGLAGAITPAYKVTGAAVGTGALCFNPLTPKRYAPYIDGVTFSSNSIASYSADSAGNPAPISSLGLANPGQNLGDSPVPEFIDRFPNPRPILYMRARVGASGIISLNGKDSNNVAANFQYDLSQITPYTTGTVGPNNVRHPLAGLGVDAMPPTGGGYALWSVSDSPPTYPPTAATPTPDAIRYFMAWSVAPTNLSDPNASGTPRGKDAYILISAGPDGLYGTYDDICSFGPVQQ